MNGSVEMKGGMMETTRFRAPRALYRPAEVAEMLSYHIDTIYTLLSIGELECHQRQPGKKGIRITGASIEAYVERHIVDSADIGVG